MEKHCGGCRENQGVSKFCSLSPQECHELLLGAVHSEQTTEADIQCASERVNFLPLDSHQEGRVRKKKRKVSLLQTLMGNSSLSVLPLPPLPSPLCFCLPELFHAQTMKECLNLQQKKCYLYSYYGLIIYIMGRHWLFKFRENESALTEAFFVLPSSISFNVHMGSTFFCLRDIERLCAKFTTAIQHQAEEIINILHYIYDFVISVYCSV